MAIPGRTLAAEDDDAWYVRAGAGENWHDFVQWTLAQGWPGLENLSLIPGTVGAAPIQNIGAYGLEAGERFMRSTRSTCRRASRRFDRTACRFGYRDSVFKQEGWHLDGLRHHRRRFPPAQAWQPLTRYADIARELARGTSPRPRAPDRRRGHRRPPAQAARPGADSQRRQLLPQPGGRCDAARACSPRTRPCRTTRSPTAA
jgi:UDP-N-acetylmuramate dehydrogenase